ncbi:MAG TPA: hypothetical protein VGJ91_09915, partial [Polyangiaceae bacterium]
MHHWLASRAGGCLQACLLLPPLTVLAACGARTGLEGVSDRSPSTAGGGAAAAAPAGGMGGVASSAAGTSGAGIGGTAGVPSVPLWRMSTQAYCGQGYLNPNPIWSDARGVYVLSSSWSPSIDIQFNGGTGWTLSDETGLGPALASLTGFVGGPLVAYGTGRCAISFVQGNANACNAMFSQIIDVFTVDAQLAYAVYQDRVLRYDGASWTQLGPPLESVTTARGVWASAETVVVVAEGGKIYLLQDGQFRLQKGVPAGDY